MKFINGLNRNQTSVFPISLEQAIGQDNEVRIIDLFVDSLKLGSADFLCCQSYKFIRVG